jgi:ATP-binding cassette, subfamily B (MDR/TAP), member 1
MVGTAAALGGGSAYPLMTLVLGNLVNAFNDLAVGRLSPAEFRDSINQNSLWFVYLFAGKFGVSSLIPEG